MEYSNDSKIANEIRSKCLMQIQDIKDDTEFIKDGNYKGSLEQAKDKILIKLENYDESLRWLDDSIKRMPNLKDKSVWTKY